MEVVAWDQSAHLLFVQLFFPRVLRSGGEKGPLKAFAHCLNSRCDGRSRNKQIGELNTCTVRALKPKLALAACRQKLAPCVKDDIRPPTIQRSRSDHICSIQLSVCLLHPLLTHTHTLVFPFITPVSVCQTGLNRPSSYIIANKTVSCPIPRGSHMRFKTLDHARLLKK